MQLNRDDALLQEVDPEAEEDSDETGQKLEELEKKLAAAQAQIATMLHLQEALVRQLLPANQAAALLQPPLEEDKEGSAKFK